MKPMIHTLKTLDWQLFVPLMFFALLLASLAIAALTSDGSLAQTATELAGRPREMGYGWGG